MADIKPALFPLFMLCTFLSFYSCTDEQFIDFANHMGDSVNIPINAEINPIYNFPVGYETFYADEYVDQLDKHVENILVLDGQTDTANTFRLHYSGFSVNYNVPFVPGLDEGFSLLDFTDMNFSQLEPFLSNIQHVWLKCNFENTLPFNIDINVMMVGMEGVLGELTSEALSVSPAEAKNTDHFVATVSRDSIKLNANQIQNLIETRTILYLAFMWPGWPDSYQQVYLDTENFLYLEMAFDVELDIVISDFILND